jgi:exonuclease SbcC
MKSVIIDEGFGSLDADGRRQMIEQLKALEGTLDRVILVSHHDAFHDAFPNGYHIEKVDGSSRAVLRRALAEMETVGA